MSFIGEVSAVCLLVTLLCQSAMAETTTTDKPAQEAPPIPQRVVSMNLCLDQLAILLAKPGQLKAITHFTQDPAMSLLFEAAKQYPAHTGTAEEVFSMDADLVLAGTYTNRATIDMLARLKRRVVTIPPADSFADIRSNILQVGEVLGQAEVAERLVADFDRRVVALGSSNPSTPLRKQVAEIPTRLSAASYGANLYMQGENSLEREMVEAAGFVHYGTQKKLGYGGRVSLEQLVMEPPDVLLLSNYQTNDMHAYAHLQHPVLEKLIPAERRSGIHSRYWACGTPFVLDAVTKLSALRKKLEAAP